MIDRNVAPNRFHPLLAVLITSAALSAAPAVASEDFQVNITTSENQQYSDVAHDTTGRFLIAWTSWPNDPYREMVHRRVYEADGTPATGELAVGSESDVFQLDAHVCGLADGGWVLAWRARTSTDGTGGIRAQRIAADGSPSGSVIVVSTDSLLADTFVRGAVNLDVACLPDGGFFVGYSEGFAPDRESIFEIDVYGRRFDSAGAPLGSSFTVNQDTEGDQGNFGGVAVESSLDGSVVVVWSSNCPVGASSAGCPVEPDGSASSTQARLYAPDGTPGDEFRANTTTEGTQGSHGVAAAFDDDGNFVLAWYDGDLSSGSCDGFLPCGGISAQQYDASGNPLGEEFRVNTAAGRNLHPVVSHDASGGLLFVWERSGPPATETEALVARRFSNDGKPRGGEFLVTSNPPNSDRDPRISAGNGNYVVTWSNYGGADGSAVGVFARVISLDNPTCPGTAASDCRTGAAKLRARIDDESGHTRLRWKWTGSNAGDLRSLEGALGFAMCFYDGDSLVESAASAPDARCGEGSCWNVLDDREIFRKALRGGAGLRRVRLMESSIVSRLEGYDVKPRVARRWDAQFRSGDGRCWQAAE
jgi:hypothetical protein